MPVKRMRGPSFGCSAAMLPPQMAMCLEVSRRRGKFSSARRVIWFVLQGFTKQSFEISSFA
ncbi:hypothetical protein BOS5A_90016 [Bosea sp. EC-HK365B]|nr:hypothetical protein BOSE7B_20023 [Bosea sp. 7B]CAD5269831.1 hypothetical protein BOSE21B_111614 [Bosea sp. 21B]VVT62562.1 hypothetical protein BOS5A_90016 [Bosea sp. EC-HK365B]VXC61644.1 hypothetical protein BOSE127_30037 [Bosea sp. 127]